MTHAISVPTPFTDIAELAENFAQRVDEERVMLPHHEPIAEGEWVQFLVTFGDGSPALAGTGRCTGSYDNGEDREPEHRFDVVMDSLELDEMGQVYFERILMVRAQQLGAAEPGTGEVAVQEVAEIEASFVEGEEAQPFEEVTAFVEAPPEEAYAAPQFEAPPEDGGVELPSAGAASFEGAGHEAEAFEAAPVVYDAADDDVTTLGHLEDMPVAEPASFEVAPEDAALLEAPELDEAAPVEDLDVAAPLESAAWDAQPAPAAKAGSNGRLTAPVHAIYELPPPSAPGQLPSPHANEAVLTRRWVEPTWSPTPMLRPDPSPSTGHFQYGGGGLPQPAEPPRPNIDPSLRIVPAPRPGDPLAAPLLRSAYDGSAAVAYQEDAHEEPLAAPEPAGYEYEEPAAQLAPELEGFEGAPQEAGTFDGDFAEEPVAVDAIVDDAAFAEAAGDEAPVAVDELEDAISFEEPGEDEPR